jgi:signal transduction histidine kinase
MHAILREEWPNCAIDVVDQRAPYMALLAKGGHDIILSDFSMANFNGLEALQLAREKCPAVPFVFLSGTIGEDRAVEAMRNGASDYVIKDRPKRLVSAMKSALANAQHLRERKAAEEQLLRVQRLENIGMLAAGIAHDFNNVLAPVLMAVPLLRDRLTEPMDQRILNSVEQSAERGAGLVREILGFAQGVTGEPHVLQPKHLLRELLGVIRQTFPDSIQVEDTIDGALWPLKVNPTQLHQVLLNLCVNARDAMPHGGALRVKASNHLVDEIHAAATAGMQPGPYVVFEVTDTGTGIPPDVLARIWEPFFTTKEAGRGTGLGLSTVRAIVENHRGVVTLQTQAGRGTTFHAYFPAAPGAAATDRPANDLRHPQGTGELVLVVDDDDNVRNIASAILTRNGYKVIAAADGAEAVALFAPRSLEVKVVVTDISMPVLDGLALLKVVRNLNPSVRVLAISGLADQEERFRRETTSPFLNKPFSMEALLASVNELLHPKELQPA